MESFTRRVEADDEPDTTEFSTMSSDNGFISSEDLRSEVSSNNVHDEGLLSADSTGSKSPSPKRMAMFEGPEILQRLNVFEEVEHGGRVAFECQCKAHPMPVYKWYKDDAELVESDRLKVEDFLEMDGTLRLIISNVRKSDEGAYRCKLENQEGVAASTGYLSVTGNNSSPNAVSTPPLLRAITEESNVSTDSDEGASSSSATLEKILTGEYDVSALPYSQYLELLKDSGALKPNADSIEKNGSRTPTEDTPHADDVKNLCTDFPYDAHTTVTDDDDVNSFEDLTVSMATNETEMDAEEIVNKPRSEVIFGTPFLTDSKTVFFIEGSRKEDVSSDEVDTESSKNSDENAEEMAQERGPGFSLEGGTLCGDNIAKTTGYEVDTEFESRIGEPSMGDFREEGVFDSLDEKKMKETMIAGRIGMPSDWEFAHYTEEGPDEVEDTLSCVPDEVDATPDLPIETIGSKYEEEEAVREAELGMSSLASESAIPAAENLETKEVLLRGVALLRDSLLGGNAQEAGDLEKIVDERKEEATVVVPENSDDSVTSSFLAEKSTSLAAEEDITRNEKAVVEDDFRLTSSDPKMLTDIESAESKSQVNGEITEESKPEGKPEIDVATKWMPDMTPFANVVSGVSNLVNWSANSATPEEVDAQTHRPEVAGSNGDQPIQSTNTTGFHFSNLMSDLTPSATAISDWIPDVSISSYLPSLSPEPLVSEGKPVDVEEVVPEFVADEAEQESKSVIDWCVDWFRYPTIFYVLLVLTMTLLASATQMNPAMVILVVALCSLLGFRLFPVHG